MHRNYAQPRLIRQAENIESLISNVSPENIAQHIEVLSEEPRDTFERQSKAANYITEQLEAFGYSVNLDPIRTSSLSPGNIIAELPGSINPDTKFIIGAHYDTVPNSPGADDNGSAVAGALEIARILRNFKPDVTIEFVFFGAEEEGLLGSQQYAAEAAANEVDINGMIALEMIGYLATEPDTQIPINSFDLDLSQNPPKIVPPGCGTPAVRVSEEGRTTGDFLGAIGNTESAELLQAFQITSNKFVSDLDILTAEVTFDGNLFPDSRRSDHASFWDNDYEALMLTDTANFRNPNYHLPTDTLDTLDLNFASSVTQAALATAIVTTSVLVVDGTRRKDYLIGTSKADKINGFRGNDFLTGLAGRDILSGGRGKDILIEVDPHSTNPGYREIDILNGGRGKDLFVLGDTDKVYYDNKNIDNPGLNDYALIEDFGRRDKIQLKGIADNYLLENNFSIDETTGTGIFWKDNVNELIGFVEGVHNLNLNSRNFAFV